MILETLHTIIDWLPILIAVSFVCLLKELFDEYWCIKWLKLPEYVYMHGFLFRSIFKFGIWLFMIIIIVAGFIVSWKLMFSVESVFLVIIFALPVALFIVVAVTLNVEITNRFLHDQSNESKINK